MIRIFWIWTILSWRDLLRLKGRKHLNNTETNNFQMNKTLQLDGMAHFLHLRSKIKTVMGQKIEVFVSSQRQLDCV